MKLIDFIKLILKHKIILFATPLLVAILAIVLTTNPNYRYYSQTMLYTGIASGSSIEMDKPFNYLATNNAFDNLINIINSRETQEEVAIRLLSKHLLLKGPNEKLLSAKVLAELKEKIPEELNRYLITSEVLGATDSINLKDRDSISLNTLVEKSSNENYEMTVTNLMRLMKSDNTNFIYSLLNFEHPYYSLKSVSKLKSMRVSSSDLVKLSFETEHPGVCQETLIIYTEVCMRKYKDLIKKGSDAVVKYFEAQLSQSNTKLKNIEEKLLRFSQNNNILNYYEETKTISNTKSDLKIEYSNMQAERAGLEASVKELEEKLKVQELVQEKSNRIIESKKRLGKLKYAIAISEVKKADSTSLNNIELLKSNVVKIQEEIKANVGQLYAFQNSIEGVSVSSVVDEWVDKILKIADLKAKMKVVKASNKQFELQSLKYAPAGAEITRLNRQIEVAEQEYLGALSGLNTAKLKYQDTQLSSNLKAVDPPYFPLQPIPSKRKIIVIVSALISFILLLGSILMMEFFNETLKNIDVATEKLNIPEMGMLAKLYKTNEKIDMIGIQDRLMELIMQNFKHTFKTNKTSRKTIVVVVLSMQQEEGKTVVVNNIARKLKNAGKSILVLTHSAIEKENTNSIRYSRLSKLLGYRDPRNDYEHPFLKETLNDSKYFFTYEIDNEYFKSSSYEDLLPSDINKSQGPFDFVLIELPNILEVNYPEDLISNSDLSILICRSNRLWSKADANLLKNIKELIPTKLRFIINGVELNEIEALLGELSKYRSKIRQKIKKILDLQFYSENQI